MKRVKGFTLVELAIVLIIVGFLLTMGFRGLSILFEQKRQAETQANLEVVHQAILDFVRFNKYVPCPDIDGDGHENRKPASDPQEGACEQERAGVPWQTLGLSPWRAKDAANGFIQLDASDGDDVTNNGNVCDPNSSASYFGRPSDCSPPATLTSAGTVFTLSTPPMGGASATIKLVAENKGDPDLRQELPLHGNQIKAAAGL